MDWAESNNIISDHHHGGRQGFSTLTAVANLQNQINKNLSAKYTNILLTTDLSAAFDTIDHVTLLRKIEHYGVRGKELRLFSSFLSDRSQMVEVDTFRSTEVKSLNCSCCQGSILANTFYSIYTNEVPLLLKIVKCPGLLSCMLSPAPKSLIMSSVVAESYPTRSVLCGVLTLQTRELNKLLRKLSHMKLGTQTPGQTSGHWITLNTQATNQRPSFNTPITLVDLPSHPDNELCTYQHDNDYAQMPQFSINTTGSKSPEPSPELHPKRSKPFHQYYQNYGICNLNSVHLNINEHECNLCVGLVHDHVSLKHLDNTISHSISEHLNIHHTVENFVDDSSSVIGFKN